MKEAKSPVSVNELDIEKRMEKAPASRHQKLRDRMVLATVMLMLIASGFASAIYTQRLRTHTNLVEQSHQRIATLNNSHPLQR